MTETLNFLKNGSQKILLRFLTKTGPSFFLSMTLFLGGIALLSLGIPFWSLFLGLPAVQIGIVLLIFTFDYFAQSKVGINSLYISSCPICQNPVLTHLWEKDKVCGECQVKTAKRFQEKKK